MNYTGFGQWGTPTAYAFGGGSISGPSIWDFSSGSPQLSQMARGLGVVGLPAGALSRQEIRNRSDIRQLMESGSPYVEMPTMYQLNQRGQYVDPITGRRMGNVAVWTAPSEGVKGGAKASSNPPPDDEDEEDTPPKRPPLPPKPPATPPPPATLPFTGFGAMVGRQNMPSLAGSLIGFGGIPRFPFAGY